MEAIARLGAAECLALGDHDGRRSRSSPARPRTPAPSSGCGRSSTSRSSAPRRRGDATQFEDKRAYVERARSRTASGWVSRRTRPTPARRRSTAPALELGLPVATHLNESRRTSSTGCSAAKGPWQPFARDARAAGGRDRHPPARRRRPARRRASSPRTASRWTRRRSSCSPAHGVAVAHCPRSNALLGCGIAPLAELSGRGRRGSGVGTDGVSSVPSHDFFEELRTVVVARARARRARRRALAQPRRWSSRRSAGRGRSGSTSEIGSLVAGKRADLAVVSLSGLAVSTMGGSGGRRRLRRRS